MAAKDAEMPNHQTLSEDIQKIANHLANLHKEVDKLTGSIKRAGSHQIDRAQDKAGEVLGSVEDSVRRDPLTSLGIAAGLASWPASSSRTRAAHTRVRFPEGLGGREARESLLGSFQ